MHFEERARDELLGLLGRLGDPDAEARITWYTGIITADTALDPVEAVAGVRRVLEDEPWSVRYCLRLVPVQRRVPADLESIAGQAGFVSGMLAEGATYKIFVKKRGSQVSGTDVIRELASQIPNGVRMQGYDRQVLVEIIGADAGISVLREEDVLSVQAARRGMS